MKKITVICALLLLLLSCGHKGDITPTSSDSSPIIISDGSVTISQGVPMADYFQNVTNKDAEIKDKTGGHKPNSIWYGCTAADADAPESSALCPAKLCDTSGNAISTACRADVSPSNTKSWTLWLCEGTSSCAAPGTVDQTWDPAAIFGDHTKMTVTSHDANNLTYTAASAGKGAKLVHTSAGHLKSATLDVQPKHSAEIQYHFVCDTSPGYPKCLTVGYYKP